MPPTNGTNARPDAFPYSEASMPQRLNAYFPAFALCATAMAAHAGILSPDLEEQLQGADSNDLVRVIVMLPDQLDKDGFVDEMKAEGKSLHERHVGAVRRLRGLSRTDQSALLEQLDRGMMKEAVFDYQPLWITNGVIVTATKETIEAVAKRRDVDIVYPNYPISLIEPVDGLEVETSPKALDTSTGSSRPTLLTIEEGVASTRAPELWALGIDGSGAIVGDMDTGADGDHPAFADRYLGLRKPASQCWFDPVTFTTFPVEFAWWGSHGTHTLGTMCGSDGSNQIGMAPGAEWIAAGVIDRISIDRTIADAILAFQWFADPDGDPFTSDDVPAVVNNSWGISPIWHGVPHCDNTFWNVIDNCEAAGAAVVYAAGNEGPGSKTLRTPADRIGSDTNVFSVGALVAGSNSIASFSSRGPSGCDDSTIKPEVTARGDNVRSSIDGGGYGTMSGTSMACPHVAGAVALLRSGSPESTPEEIKEALLNTAVDLGTAGEDNTYGTGRIDVVAALDYLGGATGSLSVDLDPVSDPVQVPSAGGPVDFDWSVSNTTDQSESFQGWLEASTALAGTRLISGPHNVTLAPDQTVNGSASVPMGGGLPDGDYLATAKIGTYPGEVIDSDSFQIVKGDGATYLRTFDDLGAGISIGNSYSGVTFSPGWTTWNSVGSPYYPPHSDPHVAYTHETSNEISFSTPVGNLSFYASCYNGYGDTYYYSVYDGGGVLLEQISTTGGQNVVMAFAASGISKLVVTGTGSWSNHHTIDDLAYDQ